MFSVSRELSAIYKTGELINLRFVLENIGGEIADNVVIEILPVDNIDIAGNKIKTIGSIEENEAKETGWDIYATKSGIYEIIVTVEYTTMYGRISENITFTILVVGDYETTDESDGGLKEEIVNLKGIFVSAIATSIMLAGALRWRRKI